jgi:tetratricopeptide (TPR) repeat protein
MGATWLRHGVWKSEVELWIEATERSPDSAEAWYGLGDAHRFALQKDAAIAAFERSVALDPSALDAWNNLGIARADLGDRPGALEAWKQALRQRPSYCKAHANIGSLAYREQDWAGAIAALNSALAYCPDNVVAHFLLGNIYYGPQRDARKAQLHYEAVVQLDRGFSQIALVKERLLQLTW